MSRTGSLLSLLAALALTGCTTVRVAEPLGDMPAALDPDAWNGTWCVAQSLSPLAGGNALIPDESGCVLLTVVDPVAAILDATDPDDTYRVHMRHIGDDRQTMYGTVEDGGRYAFYGRVRRDGRLILAWEVSASRIIDDIKTGRIEGRIDVDDAWPVPGPDLLRRVATDPTLYDWGEPPLVLVRVSP